ncbi:GTP-binding protein Di-Ras2 isoform 1-T1 [Liasis olivaceus]
MFKNFQRNSCAGLLLQKQQTELNSQNAMTFAATPMQRFSFLVENNNNNNKKKKNMPEQSNDYRVVVFGAGGVGKSSLVLRFVKGTFRDSYIPTIEDTYRQVISCDKSICTLQITDTTGSHQFPAMQRLSISKGHAFILVYSVTSRQSLEELKPIYEQICQIKGDTESIPIMLVGNKNDEDHNREVQTTDGEAMAKKWKCAFMETSAKMNHNVKELFQELLNLEKRRTVSLQIDGKKSKQQKRKEKLKGKCIVM